MGGAYNRMYFFGLQEEGPKTGGGGGEGLISGSLRYILSKPRYLWSLFSYLSEKPNSSLRCCFKYNSSKQPCEETQHFSKFVGSGGIRAVM